VGLVSALFPAADDIQHGNLARVADLLTSLTASPPAEIHLLLDKKVEIQNQGHVVLVSNMPYTGFHYQLGPVNAHKDGLLDVLFFAELSKLDLLGYVVQGVGEGYPEDPRIQHYHVRRVDITTNPEMPVMADGYPLEGGPVRIEVRRNALTMMAPQSVEPPDPETNDAAPG
jgi:diacylglycerol kinase family enzyme